MQQTNYIKLIVIGFLLAISLTACSNKAQQGAGMGALGGALVGSHLGPEDDESRLTNAAIGAGVGSLFGYAVGNEMDKYDNRQINDTLENTPTGQSQEWENPNTGNNYSATPTRTDDRGRTPERDIKIKADVNNDGQYDETVHAKAERRQDGSWELKQ